MDLLVDVSSNLRRRQKRRKLENMGNRIDVRTHVRCTSHPCDLDLDLLLQGECIPRSCHGLFLPTLVLIVRAVFLLERGQTEKQTDGHDWTPYATPAAIHGRREVRQLSSVAERPCDVLSQLKSFYKLLYN